MIVVKDLCKNYGPRRAIENLSFTVNKGDVVGFLGPNGAGKSTTMKIITGFMAPTSGTASVAGFDVFENPLEVKRRIGYLPEIPPVYADQFVRDYLIYVANLKRVSSDKINSLVDRAIQKTHLGSVQHRLVGHLSKGFRQRVGIAQALVSDPEILILDEPTVGLDPKQVAEIRELIKELRGQHTIILSTHILSEVQATCDKVIIINQGHIVAQDRIDNLAQFEKGQTRVHMRLQKELTSANELLGLPGIRKAHAGNRRNEWILELSGNESQVPGLAEAVVKNGWGLLELSPHHMDLEDVFLKLTYGQDAGAES